MPRRPWSHEYHVTTHPRHGFVWWVVWSVATLASDEERTRVTWEDIWKNEDSTTTYQWDLTSCSTSAADAPDTDVAATTTCSVFVTKPLLLNPLVRLPSWHLAFIAFDLFFLGLVMVFVGTLALQNCPLRKLWNPMEWNASVTLMAVVLDWVWVFGIEGMATI